MPIASFLNGAKFDRKTTRVMGVAFEMARIALGLADRSDQANELVAKRIIDIAKQGECNPDLLCERALKSLRKPSSAPRHPLSDFWSKSRAAHPRCRARPCTGDGVDAILPMELYRFRTFSDDLFAFFNHAGLVALGPRDFNPEISSGGITQFPN
jgi:hypothetical protein